MQHVAQNSCFTVVCRAHDKPRSHFSVCYSTFRGFQEPLPPSEVVCDWTAGTPRKPIESKRIAYLDNLMENGGKPIGCVFFCVL